LVKSLQMRHISLTVCSRVRVSIWRSVCSVFENTRVHVRRSVCVCGYTRVRIGRSVCVCVCRGRKKRQESEAVRRCHVHRVRSPQNVFSIDVLSGGL
jgi:hypothetical protein